jgi:hypothetical protein
MSIGRFIESPSAPSIVGHNARPLPVGRIISEAPCIANAKPCKSAPARFVGSQSHAIESGPAMRYTSLGPDTRLLSDP